jgi:hypothetical protein
MRCARTTKLPQRGLSPAAQCDFLCLSAAIVLLTNLRGGAVNNPFRGTLETFLNGPDSSTFGHLCNLSFTKNSARFFSCTTHGETRREGYQCHSIKTGKCRQFRAFPASSSALVTWPQNWLRRSTQSPPRVNSTFGVAHRSFPGNLSTAVGKCFAILLGRASPRVDRAPARLPRRGGAARIRKGPHWSDSSTCDILGDAAKAKILLRETGAHFQCPSAHFNPTANAA